MRIQDRHHIRVSERCGAPQAGAAITMAFMHGFGCDQTMWCYLEPLFRPRYRTVLFDLVGSGASDLHAYDVDRYARLDAHGADLRQVIHAVGGGRAGCQPCSAAAGGEQRRETAIRDASEPHPVSAWPSPVLNGKTWNN